jgi:pimeloyl-[acyl-carrier protein] methyl ester esterase
MEDGAALAYADEGAGPVVLLVHGWAAHGGFFSDLRERLSRAYRVITPTLRGHAGSERGTKRLTVETLGDDIRTLIEALDLAPIAALGWSMGAMALWSATARLKRGLDVLVVEEMGPKILNDASWSFGLSGAYASENVSDTIGEITGDWSAYVSRLAPRMFSAATRANRPELVAWAAGEMAKADPVAMAEFWRSMAAQDFRQGLREISAPVLAVHGADSQIYPEGATEFVAKQSPNGASVVLPGAGHVPHLEAPDAFFEHVRSFLRRHLDEFRTEPQTKPLREGVDP